MANSNQVREFLMSKDGIRLLPVYVGGGAVLTGSARLSREARERAENVLRQQTKEEQRRGLRGQRKGLETQIEGKRKGVSEEEKRVYVAGKKGGREGEEFCAGVLRLVGFVGDDAH